MFRILKKDNIGYKVIRDVDGDRYLLKLIIPAASKIYCNGNRTYNRGKRRATKSKPVECWLIDKSRKGLKYEPLVLELHHIPSAGNCKMFIYKMLTIVRPKSFDHSETACGAGIHYYCSAKAALNNYSGKSWFGHVELNNITTHFTYYD